MEFDEPIYAELYDAHGNKLVLTDLSDTNIENNITYISDGTFEKEIIFTCKAEHMMVILAEAAAQLAVLDEKEAK